jgi:hypothetical protein
MFEYIIRNIEEASFSEVPFRHIYLENFLSQEHFSALINSPEISIPAQYSDKSLFNALFDKGYKIIHFPGCVTDQDKYLDWHENRSRTREIHSACEGFGITFRLMAPQSEILKDLKNFLASEEVNEALAKKFEIDFLETLADNGIQKYLDGYEISPHPDIRKKALTYMVNINPREGSERINHHTHYLSLLPQYSYVQKFWENNPDCQRCWVPWKWCETVFVQGENNSIVIFAPSNDTLHAVKASYDHLDGQRTQLYGNLWFKNSDEDLRDVEWEDLDVRAKAKQSDLRGDSRNLKKTKLLRRKIASVLPASVKSSLKKMMVGEKKMAVGDNGNVIKNRFKK